MNAGWFNRVSVSARTGGRSGSSVVPLLSSIGIRLLEFFWANRKIAAVADCQSGRYDGRDFRQCAEPGFATGENAVYLRIPGLCTQPFHVATIADIVLGFDKVRWTGNTMQPVDGRAQHPLSRSVLRKIESVLRGHAFHIRSGAECEHAREASAGQGNSLKST